MSNKIIYHEIEGADRKLRDFVMSQAIESGFTAPEMIEEIERELAIIGTLGSASGYLVVLDALESVAAKEDEYWFGGTITSAFVPFLIGFSKNNPFDDMNPRIYPEFCYGIEDSVKEPGFDIRVTKELETHLCNYFSNYERTYPGSGVSFEMEMYEHDWIKVFVVSGEEDDEHKNMHINILPIKSLDVPLDSVIAEDVMDICAPHSFDEYVKCFGLSRGTGIWEGNMKQLLTDGVITTDQVISHREDVYEILLNVGMEKNLAYKITEDIRKGKINRKGWDKEIRSEFAKYELQDWFYDCCEKIQYLWPRSHAMSFIRFHCKGAFI